MRIPPSVIVMSLVTAVPFGLAIRDTARHHDSAGDDEVDFDGTAQARHEREADLKQYEEQEAKERAEAAERLERRVRRLHEIYGAHPASLGSLFDDLKLGAPANPSLAERVSDYAGATNLSIELEPDDKPDRIKLAAFSDDGGSVCTALGEQVSKAWGAPVANSDDDVGSMWFDRAASQVAWFKIDGDSTCNLVFARVTDPATLVTKTATSVVPMWAFGGPASKLDGKLPVDATTTDDALIWDAPGLGATQKATRIEADVTKGKITSMYASGTTDDDTFAALVAQLTKLYGAPKQDADSGQLTWKHPAMALDRHGNTWLLGLGATP